MGGAGRGPTPWEPLLLGLLEAPQARRERRGGAGRTPAPALEPGASAARAAAPPRRGY